MTQQLNALSVEGTAFTIISTGGNCRAWQLVDPEVEELAALVTRYSDADVPLENEPFVVTIYNDRTGDEVKHETFTSETGLRDWYQRNVGHRMEGESLPKMLELVAGSMLFTAMDALRNATQLEHVPLDGDDTPNVYGGSLEAHDVAKDRALTDDDFDMPGRVGGGEPS